MENNFEQYEALLDSVSEVASACLNMEGGAFLLAWIGELIRDLAARDCIRSASFAAQKLYEAAGVECRFAEYDELKRVEKQAWLELFAEALTDCVTADTEQ